MRTLQEETATATGAIPKAIEMLSSLNSDELRGTILEITEKDERMFFITLSHIDEDDLKECIDNAYDEGHEDGYQEASMELATRIHRLADNIY